MLKVKRYTEQIRAWPNQGKYIMAQYDEDTVVVYQAYSPKIADFAIREQFFGGEFKYTRMSWIKPNFLWMMYRCGWGTKEGQEKTLAIHLYRTYFDSILANAHPSYCPEGMEHSEWKRRVEGTNVRLQWDPDHDPFGAKEQRKAIQLGLRNEFLKPFDGSGIKKIVDMTHFVAEQHHVLQTQGAKALVTPEERAYEVNDSVKSILDM